MEWTEIEPVLNATYKLLADTDQVEGEAVCETLGVAKDDESTARAFEHLIDSGYLIGSYGGSIYMAATLRATEKGLQHCSGWPSGSGSEAFLDAFLRAIEERANDPDTPEEERRRLRQFGEAAGALSKEFLAEVTANIATGLSGMS